MCTHIATFSLITGKASSGSVFPQVFHFWWTGRASTDGRWKSVVMKHEIRNPKIETNPKP